MDQILSTKLVFRCQVSHTYFERGQWANWEVVPTGETHGFLQQFKIKLIQREAFFDLVSMESIDFERIPLLQFRFFAREINFQVFTMPPWQDDALKEGAQDQKACTENSWGGEVLYFSNWEVSSKTQGPTPKGGFDNLAEADRAGKRMKPQRASLFPKDFSWQCERQQVTKVKVFRILPDQEPLLVFQGRSDQRGKIRIDLRAFPFGPFEIRQKPISAESAFKSCFMVTGETWGREPTARIGIKLHRSFSEPIPRMANLEFKPRKVHWQYLVRLSGTWPLKSLSLVYGPSKFGPWKEFAVSEKLLPDETPGLFYREFYSFDPFQLQDRYAFLHLQLVENAESSSGEGSKRKRVLYSQVPFPSVQSLHFLWGKPKLLGLPEQVPCVQQWVDCAHFSPPEKTDF